MGNFHRRKKTILTQTAGASATVTGSALRLIPSKDDIPDHEHTFMVVFKTTGASMSSTPSITPSLETSWDGTNWMTVATGTALTANGTSYEQKAITGNLGPFVRGKATIAGTATFTGIFDLVSNGHFTTAAVA